MGLTSQRRRNTDRKKHNIQKQVRQVHAKHVSHLLEGYLYRLRTPNDSGGILKAGSRSVLAFQLQRDVSDNTQQAEILNEQFKSVFSQENTTAPPEIEGDHFLSMPELNIVKVTGVEELLQTLNPGKVSGPDSVPNRILKLCTKKLAPMLTFLFNFGAHCVAT